MQTKEKLQEKLQSYSRFFAIDFRGFDFLSNFVKSKPSPDL